MVQDTMVRRWRAWSGRHLLHAIPNVSNLQCSPGYGHALFQLSCSTTVFSYSNLCVR